MNWQAICILTRVVARQRPDCLMETAYGGRTEKPNAGGWRFPSSVDVGNFKLCCSILALSGGERMASGALPLDSNTPAPLARRRGEYALLGHARAGGEYNSHLLSFVVFAAIAALGWMNVWLFGWLVTCLAAALLIDDRPWRIKVNLSAMPGQLGLYLQVLAQAAWDLFPFYVLAYGLYVCTVPYIAPLNLAVSSFVLLYAIFMIGRTCYLVVCLWRLGFRWESAGRTFEVHKANLHSRSAAIRHVLWAYFLGNIGIVVRCGIQVVTLSGFELLRQRSNMDLLEYPAAAPHLFTIFVVAVVIWLATLWPSINRMLLVYYRTHRTFHANYPLFSSIHSIHHLGVLPTPLDSGTISPAEFWITEMAVPTVAIVPNWYFTIVEIILAIAGHLPAHDVGTRWAFSQHHVQHHRRLKVNLGLTSATDAEFGTLYTEKQPAVVEASHD